MFEHILVPLDGSSLAECVLPHAEHFAHVFGSRLSLLEVLEPAHFTENGSTVEPLNWQIQKAEADLYLQGVATRIREKGMTVTYTIREGRAPENIVDFAHQEDIDLVILSTHGASGLSRWSTSSVTAKVLEKIYLPVLLVRAYREGAAIATAVSSQAEHGFYGSILMPIDCSRRAECAMAAATRLIDQEPDSTLFLAAVIHPPELPLPAPYPEEIEHLSRQMLDLSRANVQEYLGALQARIPGLVEIKIMEEDSVFVAIHELAEQEEVGLVILCAHGKTGGLRWPYGSVSRNYIEYGARPVLIIQDVPRAQVRPTAAETAAEKAGRR